MTRLELLQLVVRRARSNGFELRRWYIRRLELPWINTEAALTLLETQRRYYALLFSHEFASTFWKAGEEITFKVPTQTFQRTMPDGSVRTITRKPYIRRSARPDVWRYHLRQMAVSEEPLRYLRKYLHLEEELEPDQTPAKSQRASTAKSPEPAAVKPARTKTAAKKRTPRPIPAGLPAFLRKPYNSPQP